MKSHFLTSVLPLFISLITMSLFSCNTNGVNSNTVTSDSSTNSMTKQDTDRSHQPVKAVVDASDSVTPNAQNATEDSIGSKISIHRGKIKGVDTTKNDN